MSKINENPPQRILWLSPSAMKGGQSSKCDTYTAA